MRTLKNWTAKRAGAKMTIYAMEWRKNQPDVAVRITSVDKITKDERGDCIATTASREQFLLI